MCVCAQQSVFLKGKATVGGHVKASLIQRTCGSLSNRMLQAKELWAQCPNPSRTAKKTLPFDSRILWNAVLHKSLWLQQYTPNFYIFIFFFFLMSN